MSRKEPLDLSKLSTNDFPFIKKLSHEQEDMVNKLYRTKRVIVDSVAGSGKALKHGSKVQTPIGPINIEDLRVGDEVFNTQGTVSRVTGVFPQGKKEVWEVTFSDGNVIECSGDHLWSYQTSRMRNSTNNFKVATIKEIYEKEHLKIKSGSHYRNNIYIPMTNPVQYSTRNDLYIPPYVLGILLGDGYLDKNGSIKITNSEEDVMRKVNTLLSYIGYRLGETKGKGFNEYPIVMIKQEKESPLRKELETLGLNDYTATDKFIPKKYLYADVEQRLDLLRGLIDSDGYCKGTSYEYVTSSNKLVNDVKFLVESLGMTAKISIKEKPEYTYKGEKRTGNTSYRLFIKTSDIIQKIHSSNKHEKRFKKGQSTARRTIQNIKPTGMFEDMTCISVDSDDKLFLTDNFIVTHNTTVLTQAMKALLEKDYIKKVYYVVFPVQEDSLGFLPGDLPDKIVEYAIPFVQALKEAGVNVSVTTLPMMCDELVDTEFNIVPHTFLRGRTIEEAGVIIDEAQNGTVEELRKIFTRLSDSNYIAIAGHNGQTDIENSGFSRYIHHFKQGKESGIYPHIEFANLTHNFRGEFSSFSDMIK